MSTGLLTILITTRDRAATLDRCLAAIERSDDLGDVADIVVVDDGSADQTSQMLEEWRRTSRVTTVVRNATSRGPASARNAGIRVAQGEYVLIMGDDTIVLPSTIGLFCRHVKTHDLSAASVIGNILPPPDETTAFEYWSCHGGSQFGHSGIPPERAMDAGEEHFYTCNVLTPTAILREYPFDESFKYARYEDRELSYRLKRRIQHRIHYLAEAKSYHWHKMPFVRWLQSFDRFAWSALHFAGLYPQDRELRRRLGIDAAEQRTEFYYAALLDSVAVLNRSHRRFFDPSTCCGAEWVKPIMQLSFRHIQEFFRTNHYRRHLGLPQLTDPASGVDAEAAMTRILAEIDGQV